MVAGIFNSTWSCPHWGERIDDSNMQARSPHLALILNRLNGMLSPFFLLLSLYILSFYLVFSLPFRQLHSFGVHHSKSTSASFIAGKRSVAGKGRTLSRMEKWQRFRMEKFTRSTANEVGKKKSMLKL